MFSVSESIQLDHAVAKVFPVAADPLQHINWDPRALLEVAKLNPGPLAQGARYRVRFRVIGTLEYECVEYKPDDRCVLFANTLVGKMRHIFQVENIGEGTQLMQTLIVDPNFLGRSLSPLLRRILKKRLRTLNQEIRDYLGK